MNKYKRVKSIKNKNLGIYAVIIVLVLVATIYAGYRSLVVSPNISLVGTNSGLVTLSINPSDQSLIPGQEQSFTIDANSGTNHLTGVQGDVVFDPSKISIVSITQGDLLSLSLQDGAVTGNKVSFVYTAPAQSGGVTGSGHVATIKVKALSEGTTSLSFGNSTEAYVTEMENNAIKTAANANISIAAAQASAAASATASIQASAAASAVASAQASAQASARASAVVSAQPSLAASATPKTSNTPTNKNTTVSSTTTLRLIGASCASLTFSWDKITNAKGYLIELSSTSNFSVDNKSSGTLSNSINSYVFSGLKAGNKYYVRVSQTDIPDFPRWTALSGLTTLPTCEEAKTLTTPTPTPATNKVVQTIENIFKPSSPTPTPTPAAVVASPDSTGSIPSLAPVAYTDNRFQDIDNTPTTSDQTNSNQSLFARFIAWVVSLFDGFSN